MRMPNVQRVRYTNADDSAQPWGFQPTPVRNVTLQGNAFSFTKPSGTGMDGVGRTPTEMPSSDATQPYYLSQSNISPSGQGGPPLPSFPNNTSQDTFHRPMGAPGGITIAVPLRSDNPPSHMVYSSSHCPSPTVGSDSDLCLNFQARTRSNTVLNGAPPTLRLDMDYSDTGCVALTETKRGPSNADSTFDPRNAPPLHIVTHMDVAPREYSASTLRKPEPPPKPAIQLLSMSPDTISLTLLDCHQISHSILPQDNLNGWSPGRDTEQFPVAKDHPSANRMPLVDGPGPPVSGAFHNPSHTDAGSQYGNMGNSSVVNTESRGVPTSKPDGHLDESEEDEEDSEDERNLERDRYGFSKSNQYLTREEYQNFEQEYEPIIEQRKWKWRRLFMMTQGQWPPRSSKLKRYVRKGIPSEIRGPCWFHYSGAARKYRDNPTTYRKWVQMYLREGRQTDFADIIERDLHRTFPDNEHFQIRLKALESTNGHISVLRDSIDLKSPIGESFTPDSASTATSVEARQKSCVESLRRILNVFTLYYPHVGYNQSLSYIVGLLLLFLSEERTFWMLVTIVEDLMPAGYFNLSQEYSLIDQEVLLSLLEIKMPHVHRHLCQDDTTTLGGGGGNPPDILPLVFLAMSHWFPLLFVDVLPVESVLRVWDCFFYEGSKVLFRVALTLFKLNEDALLRTRDSLEQFQLVQEFPKKMIHCHHLMEVCFSRAVALSRTDIGELRRQHYNRRKRRSMMLKLQNQQRHRRQHLGIRNRTMPIPHSNRTFQRAFLGWRT
ncbi:hypothetical protein IWQ61_001824 [Dispira simplex]|nr:hypothetical protein IWQ61_001824 [Dispira simplex]